MGSHKTGVLISP